MADLEFTRSARKDLLEIAEYTLRGWGSAQAVRYQASLARCMSGMSEGSLPSRPVFRHRSDVRVRRCEHHYVFAIERPDQTTLIVAVLHEATDRLVRLRERLGEEVGDH